MNNQEKQEILNKIPKHLLDDFEKFIKQSEYDHTFKIKNKFYVDLFYLQDIKLGAIQSLLQNQDEYDYFLSKVPEYNRRMTKETCSYFSELGMNDDELVEYIKNPKYTKYLLMTSPLTTAYGLLVKQLMRFHETNLRLNVIIPDYHFYVNIYPIKLRDKDNNPIYSEEDMKLMSNMIKAKFKFFHKDAKVYLVDFPTNEIPQDMLTSTHAFLVEDVADILGNPRDEEMIFGKGALATTAIYSAIRCSDKVITEYQSKITVDDDPDFKNMLEKGELAFSIISQFYYYNPLVLIEGEEVSVKEIHSPVKEDYDVIVNINKENE